MTELIERQIALQKEAKEYWKDKSNSLESRWKVFNHFADTYMDYTCAKGKLESLWNWYKKELQPDRYQTILWKYVIESYFEEVEDRPQEVIDRFCNYLMEKVMESGYKGFKYDW